MKQKDLIAEYQRLCFPKTLDDSHEIMDIYMNYLFEVIQKHHNEATTRADMEAIMINQMIFTKICHLRSLTMGIEFVARNGSKLNKIIDPTLVAGAIRNLYEMVVTFNLIYVHTKSEDEKLILYNLWVSAGLKFRQRFAEQATQEENVAKVEKEKAEIEALKKEIEDTELYKSLAEKDQKKIQEKLKKKDFKIEFLKGKVSFLDWQDLFRVLGVKSDIMNNMYTYFSLYTHPSNVSVFQFADMFSKEDESFLQITNFNLKNFFFFLAMFCADYIKLFPNVLDTFNNLPQIEQIVINRQNMLLRDEANSINDEYKALG